MIGMDVTIAKGDLARAKRLLRAIPRGFEKAATRAINKTAVRLRTVIVKAVRAETPGLKVGVIRKNTSIRRASFSRLSATISVGGRRVPLIEMSPNPKTMEADLGRAGRRGVSYRKAAGPRARIPEAFVARMPSGHTGVFRRVQGRMRADPNRQAIAELMGPSVAEVVDASSTIGRRVVKAAGDFLVADIGTQVDLMLRRARK